MDPYLGNPRDSQDQSRSSQKSLPTDSETLHETTDLDQPATELKEEDDVPPDGGWGWVCVAAVFWINAHTWGINSSYGIFLASYLADNSFPGSTYLEFALIGGLSISQALMISPLSTFVTRTYGTRTTLLIGVFFETLSLVGASFATRIWQLFLSQGICFGWGMGFLFVGSVGVVPQWFLKRRSMANGIATGGSGIGGIIYSLGTNAMIQNLSLAWAFRILAILQFTVNLTCALLIKDRNKQIGTSNVPFDYRLFKRLEFLLMLGWGFFSMLGYIVLLFSLPNYALSVGLTAEQGSVIAAVLNLGQGLGRPLIGYFSDAAGRINIAGLLTFLCGLFCFVIWIFAKNYGVLIFFALIVGPVAGTFWATVGPVGAEVLDLKDLPSGLSITWVILVIPTTFSEAIALELRQPTGNIYLRAQIFTASMYIAAAMCAWFLRARKIGQYQTLQSEKQSHGEDNEAPVHGRSGILRRLTMWKKV